MLLKVGILLVFVFQIPPGVFDLHIIWSFSHTTTHFSSLIEIHLFFYLLPGSSHSWAQQPFHQFFLQHDGIHPKPLRHWRTEIATGLTKVRKQPSREEEKASLKPWDLDKLFPCSLSVVSNTFFLFLLLKYSPSVPPTFPNPGSLLLLPPLLPSLLSFSPLPRSAPTLPVQTGTEEF